jgi:hypothetical protein
MTHRLEEKARKLGCDCEIKVIEPSEEGHYFVTRVGEEVLKSPASLGWTDEQAIDALKRGTWRRTAEGEF